MGSARDRQWHCSVLIQCGIRSPCLRLLVLVSVSLFFSLPLRAIDLVFDETGGMISGASPAYNVEEMTYTLRTAQAKILMTAESSLSVAIPAARNAGISQDRIILLEGQRKGFTTVKDLLDLGQNLGVHRQTAPFKIPSGQTNKDLCGFLSFSSGTTGLPKAVGTGQTFYFAGY